ncbi:hypothetical protein SAMN05421761_103402, partial [Belliella pelovolcani]
TSGTPKFKIKKYKTLSIKALRLNGTDDCRSQEKIDIYQEFVMILLKVSGLTPNKEAKYL